MMKSVVYLVFTTLLFAAVVSSESQSSELLQITRDGWYTWHVDTNDDLQVYALIESGRPVQVVVPTYHCGREAVPDAVDLGDMNEAESVAWLQRFIAPRTDVSSDLMAAISAHANAAAAEALGNVLRSDTSRRNREEALFWLAQTDSDAAFDIFDRLLSSGG
jgi:hypothetical protein